MKTARLSVRIDPQIKKRLEQLAMFNCRSVSDEITWLVLKADEQRKWEAQKEMLVSEGIVTCEDLGE